MDFKSVTRHELIGKSGEKTRFDLRYFEIAPGGYSSLEKHIHEHVIIGARGTGHLLCGNDSFTLQVNDIAYVPPNEAHQLRNESDEPFGFYCIVDHERDKPVVVLSKQQTLF
jgi:ribulose-bisphosphate carboxylase large chain